MNSRERLLAALRHEPVDRLPWTVLATDYYWNTIPRPLGQQLDNLVSLLEYIGADILDLCFDLPATVTDPGVTETSELIGRSGTLDTQVGTSHGSLTGSGPVGDRRTTLETPVGVLTESRERHPEAGTTFRRKHFIAKPADLGIMEYVYRKREYTPAPEAARRRVDSLGDRGVVAFFGIRSPLQMFLEELAGLQNGLFLLHDHPGEVESLFDAIHEKNKEAFRMVAKSAFEFVICVEDTSTTVISPRLFEKYVVPCLNDYAAILHQTGKIVGAHMCGHLHGLVGQLRTLDLDGIESLSPPPTGDLELPDAVARLGDRFFIIGGISAPPLVRQSPHEIYDSVALLLSQLPSRSGLVLQVTDDVSPDTPLENLQAIGRAVEAFG